MNSQVMKKAVAVVLVSGGLTTIHASDGIIHFKGSVIEEACTVTLPEPIVSIRPISRASITAAAAGSRLKHPATFTINLSDCDTGKTNAIITFGSEQDADNDYSSAFKLNSSSTAKGVGITIWDSNNAILRPGVAAAVGQSFTDKAGGSLTYQTAYMVTNPGSAKGGVADADVNFTIAYP